MSMCYECDECGVVIEYNEGYAPAREGDPVSPIDCECGGVMVYICEGHFDEHGHLVEEE